ncbi:PAS domain S-box-containing protein [Streptomyces sp. DvalAA-14]|uniref:SpoIIE family protein phosphatase n=1 Tax=unclassified Streptomyces TaxID=2593676 RepID=UPI00081BAFD7|nr:MULTISPECIES: SpoIIE family protein phosphatase [unclassified Streptomyces]MYS20153.1 SpoIIE family protein phosphatase [Streptomyces sp. SID4948]SCD62110.1 PAS domain S-box-containing protein [Streptomyces sp. DvalAA-14]
MPPILPPPPGPAGGPPFGDWLWQSLLHGTQAGVAVLDTELRYRYVNPALARINGVPAAEHIGRTIAEVVPGVAAREDRLLEVLADGVPREVVSTGQTHAASPHPTRYWQGSYQRLTDADGRVLGIGAVILEVSADREIQRELERARERLLLLDAAAVRIGTTLEMDRTCQELADLLVEVMADAAGVDVLASGLGEGQPSPPPDTLRLRRAALAGRPELWAYAEGFMKPGEYVDYRRGSPVPRCLETGLPVVLNLLPDEELSETTPRAEEVASYRAAHIHSGLIVPLSARGDQLGTVTLIRAGSSPGFDDDDVAVARALADRAAISLDNARRYSREHGIAVELQRALLATPGAPHPRIDVATRYLPAGETDLVGGDWFDTLALPGGMTLLAMGDVMGHGVEAAVEMSHYRAMLRVVSTMADRPGQMLRRMDAVLSAAGTERPGTCLLGLADPLRGGAWFASAGHLPPAVITPTGGITLLDVPPGPPLGADLDGEYETVYVPWHPGHILLLYTDGLVERRTEDIDASLSRLAGLTMEHATGPLDALLAGIVRRLAPGAAEDDVALLAARARQ